MGVRGAEYISTEPLDRLAVSWVSAGRGKLNLIYLRCMNISVLLHEYAKVAL